MNRAFTIELYDTHDILLQTLTASGSATQSVKKYFCTIGAAKKYVVKDEMGRVVSEQNIYSVLPGVTSTTSNPNLTTEWKTLDVCCNKDWLQTEDTEKIITDQNQDPLILSS